MKKLIYCFDLDNVLCKSSGSNYKKSKPILKYKILKIFKKKGHFKKFSLQDIRVEIMKIKCEKTSYKFTKINLKSGM